MEAWEIYSQCLDLVLWQKLALLLVGSVFISRLQSFYRILNKLWLSHSDPFHHTLDFSRYCGCLSLVIKSATDVTFIEANLDFLHNNGGKCSVDK